MTLDSSLLVCHRLLSVKQAPCIVVLMSQTSRRIDHGVTAEYMVMAAATQPTDETSVFCVTRSGQVIGADDPGASWQGFRLPQGVHNVYAVACI